MARTDTSFQSLKPVFTCSIWSQFILTTTLLVAHYGFHLKWEHCKWGMWKLRPWALLLFCFLFSPPKYTLLNIRHCAKTPKETLKKENRGDWLKSTPVSTRVTLLWASGNIYQVSTIWEMLRLESWQKLNWKDFTLEFLCSEDSDKHLGHYLIKFLTSATTKTHNRSCIRANLPRTGRDRDLNETWVSQRASSLQKL